MLGSTHHLSRIAPEEILSCPVPFRMRHAWTSSAAISTANLCLRSPPNCDSPMTPSAPSGAPSATTARRGWPFDTTPVDDPPPAPRSRSATRRASSSTTTRPGVPAGSAWSCSATSRRPRSPHRACSNGPSSVPESTGHDGRSARRRPWSGPWPPTRSGRSMRSRRPDWRPGRRSVG
jgi:hypothetical protein